MSVNYYNEHGRDFFEGTVNVDMHFLYDIFESYVPAGGNVLDAGCGSGRDVRYFLEKGYNVEGIDASIKMSILASRYTGKLIKCLSFHEIAWKDHFDGIWACASLLHLDDKSSKIAFSKLIDSLKDDGILFASFKYGNRSETREGRFFRYHNEESLREIISKFDNIKLLDFIITDDVREEKKGNKWINLIVKKVKK